jgi:uncharacterized protein (DUF736 family)
LSPIRLYPTNDDLALLPHIAAGDATRCAGPPGTLAENRFPRARARSPQFSACRLPLAPLRTQGQQGRRCDGLATINGDEHDYWYVQLRQEGQHLQGRHPHLSFQFSAVDITPTVKNGDKEPDYRVTARAGTGHVELGAAWKRTSDKGREFISVSLDAPLLTAPLNAALFIDGSEASLVWTRIRKVKNAAVKKAA